jgi:protein gp37
MSSGSDIEWTDATWNPVTGCTAVSPGCLNCYAAAMSSRLEAMGQPKYRGLTTLHNGRRVFNGAILTHDDALKIPSTWKEPKRVFVNSMSDLFHESVPFEFVDRVFAVMALGPQHTFQVLTKRPERMAEYLADHRSPMGMKTDENVWKLAACMDGRRFTDAYKPRLNDIGCWPLPGVWLGTSVEDHERADERIPQLLRCPAAVRFLSVEPLLGPIEFSNISGINWIIVGGESGPRARTCRVEWIDSIIAQCKAIGIPCFVKQLGSRPRATDDEFGDIPISLKDAKGGDPDEWPADLRVREFPAPGAGVAR